MKEKWGQSNFNNGGEKSEYTKIKWLCMVDKL